MGTLEELQKRFTDEIRYVDDIAQVVLKGHLVMEDLMTEAIQTFLFHGDMIEDAQFRFAQKIALCRGISTSEQSNGMWTLIAKINSLRNALSHSLDLQRRAKAIEAVRLVYIQEFPDHAKFFEKVEGQKGEQMSKELAICLGAIAACIGFLHPHLEEVKRFKAMVVSVDAVANGGAISRPEKVATK